ncbi:hypothetical protein Shfl1p87 [Shigella phage Shfl1]|uniref:Uncharacterized protein n=1 Tax=Shigella phage Shfl1 TaxID=2919551 RepID=F2VWV3_9CAUD|nr:hypothetical protein Shfl1p87 [Shigella phage Shfl1]AEA72961.1 hypothetical protein Shfl1p87 [Shigella phage Shfl1]
MEPEFECAVRCISVSTDSFTNQSVYEIYLIDGGYFATDNHQNQIGVFRSMNGWDRFLTNDGKTVFKEVTK